MARRPLTVGLALLFWWGGGRCGEASGEVITDGTLGPASALGGPAFDIPASLGTQAGGNLFHSFSRFNLASGESATFSGPPEVGRVLARVTGGQASSIDGTIRCTIAGADVFLINPAGIVFGATASLDVSGSFVATTADFMRHEGGGRFDAARPQDSVLTSAPPAAFGFLAAAPAPITLRGGGTIKERPSDRIVPLAGSLTVSEGKSVQLVGGKITLEGGLAAAPGGRVDLAALASPGEVGLVPADLSEPLTVTGATALADVVLLDAGLDTGGLGPGVITVRARDAHLERSFVGARVFGAIDGRGIHFDLTGDLTLLDTDVASDSDGNATARAGDVFVEAVNFTIEARERLSDLASDSFAPGPAGDVRVDLSGNLTLISRGGTAALSSTAVRGGGNGGSVTVNAQNVLVTAEGVTNNPLPFGVLPVLRPDGTFEFLEIAGLAAISAAALEGGGNAGRVEVNARDEVRVESGGVIASGSLGPGAGGGLKITARRLVASRGESPFVTTIQTGSLFPAGGDGGDLEIDVRELTVLDGALVSAATVGTGDGGNVTIRAADRIRLKGDARTSVTGVLATSQRSGAGGDIRVETGRLMLRGGTIQSASAGGGRAGTVEITARQATLKANAAVTTSAPLSEGGSMMMDAGQIELVGSQLIAQARLNGGNVTLRTPAAIALSDSRVSASTSEGTGGRIGLDADVVGLNDSALVAAAIEGNGGDVDVSAAGFLRSPGSVIDTSSVFGMAGSVNVTMPDMDVSSSLATLSSSFTERDAQLAEKCALRAGTVSSSFVYVGRGGAPLAPGGWSPSGGPTVTNTRRAASKE